MDREYTEATARELANKASGAGNNISSTAKDRRYAVRIEGNGYRIFCVAKTEPAPAPKPANSAPATSVDDARRWA